MSYQIIEGDCLDVMRGMPDKSFDAVITDPPYGLAFRGNAWDNDIPVWLDEARRLAPVVAFTTGPLTLWDYPRPDWVCCWYREASSSRSLLRGFNHWTPVLVYGKPRFPVDSIKLHAIQHAYPKGFPHPTPKPLAFMEWLVSRAVPEGGAILDPFAGSGTTGIAALNLGHSFIGVEKDPGYAEFARGRLADLDLGEAA